jgi:hypothetical protein
MNWKLILLLSGAGVMMALASAFGLIKEVEPFLWLIIFVLYAYVIAKKVDSRHFLYGFLVSVVNGIWIGSIHAALFSTYIANNPEVMATYEQMPHVISPQVTMILFGLIIGAVTGLVAGLFAWGASKIVKKS